MTPSPFSAFWARLFRNINTKVVIAVGFAIVILLGLLPALLSDWALDHSTRVTSHFIDADKKVADLCLTSIAKMIKVRRNEKDFLLSYRDFGFQEAKSRYITTLGAEIADIRDNMARIRQLADDPGIVGMTREIDRSISDYHSGIEHAVELYGELGTAHSGIEGEIRTVAERIESLLRREHRDDLLAALFSLRSREKDYFLQDLDARLAAVMEATNALKRAVASSSLAGERKSVLLRQVELYAALVNRYSRTSEAIRAARRQYLHSLQNVEPALERLNVQMVEKTRQARAGIQASEKHIKISIAVSLGLTIIASLIVSLLVFRILRDAEKSLQASEQKYRALFETSPDAVVITDMAATIMMVNKQALLLSGYDAPDELVGRNIFDFLAPADREIARDRITRRLKLEPPSGRPYRLVRKNGEQISIEGNASPVSSTGSEPEHIIFAVRDVTARMLAEGQVRFLASIIENMPDAVCAINRDARIIAWNRGAETALGHRAADIIGKPVTTIIPEEIAQKELDHCLAVLNTEGFFSGVESTRLASDGRRIPVELTGVAIRDAEGRITNYASIIIDITNRKRAELERLRGSTLRSIGLLAGGIAHDINNLLTVIVGDIQMTQAKMQQDHQSSERLTHALEMCRITSDLSRRFITFSTGGDPLLRSMPVSDLTVLLDEAVQEAMKDAGLGTELQLPRDLQGVAIDDVQMRQVVHNLAMNAKEAMPKGGSFFIRGENITVAADDSLPIRQGSYVRLSFTDSGIGIAAENLAKIFDPYYSTKDTYSQKGLGLGLAVCYSVIKKHNGLLTVESEPGKGTTFYIYLPAVNAPRGTLVHG